MQHFYYIIFLRLCILTISALDPPEYIEHIEYLFTLGRKQANYIIDLWQIPGVRNNVGLAYWPYPIKKNDIFDLESRVVLTWQENDISHYMIMDIYDYETKQLKTSNWTIVARDWIETIDLSNNNDRNSHFTGKDSRLIYNPKTKKLYMEYNDLGILPPHYFEMFLHEIFFDVDLFMFYIKMPPIELYLRHEEGIKHQKNWSPFLYNNEMLFIYSIYPHRIVASKHSFFDSEANRTSYYMHTVANMLCTLESDNTTDIRKLWKYGIPHGGSNAILINTRFGLRYLTFFHSSGQFNMKGVLTYYMGAYLFSQHYPWDITHITPDPIIPLRLYDERFGWAWKPVDYVVFPTGLIVINDSIILSMGHNDREGWIITFNKTLLIDSFMNISCYSD